MAGVTKKRDARRSVSQPGWITLDGGFAARQCVVDDLSATGAKITVDNSGLLPARLRAGDVARCAHRPDMRSDLASRQVGRRQVRPLTLTTSAVR